MQELFYNRNRLHSSIDYFLSEEYECIEIKKMEKRIINLEDEPKAGMLKQVGGLLLFIMLILIFMFGIDPWMEKALYVRPIVELIGL